MTSAELRAALAAAPFRPFRLNFGSGRAIEIANPSLVVVSETGRVAFAFRPASDAFDVIDILLIESMEFPDRSARNGPAQSNGH